VLFDSLQEQAQTVGVVVVRLDFVYQLFDVEVVVYLVESSFQLPFLHLVFVDDARTLELAHGTHVLIR